MKITVLKERQFSAFLAIDPYGMLSRKDLRADVVLGLTEETGSGDMPAGLLAASLKGEHLIIYWLYVTPGCRFRGYGEALLLAALQQAHLAGKTKIGAVFSAEYGRETICAGERRFFTERMFRESGKDRILVAELADMLRDMERTLPEDAMAQLADSLLDDDDEARDVPEQKTEVRKLTAKDRTLKISDVKKNATLCKPEPPESIRPVSALDPNRMQEGIRRCLSSHPYDFFEQELLTLPVSWFDLGISSAAVEEGKVCGLFLVHPEEGGRLWAEYLCYAGKDAQNGVMNLLRFSAKAAIERCDKKTEVIVRCHNRSTKALVERLFPGKGKKGVEQ